MEIIIAIITFILKFIFWGGASILAITFFWRVFMKTKERDADRERYNKDREKYGN